MGVRILQDNHDEIAVLYCSTSDWAFGPVFRTEHGHGRDGSECPECPHYPSELAEQFCDWFTMGFAATAARELGITPVAIKDFGGTDPREFSAADLERLYNRWRSTEPWKADPAYIEETKP